jgi:hypothetical protein
VHRCPTVHCQWSSSRYIIWLSTHVWVEMLWKRQHVLLGSCGRVWTNLFKSIKWIRYNLNPCWKRNKRIS